jgi:hypothetical protein
MSLGDEPIGIQWTMVRWVVRAILSVVVALLLVTGVSAAYALLCYLSIWRWDDPDPRWNFWTAATTFCLTFVCLFVVAVVAVYRDLTKRKTEGIGREK